MKRRRISRTVRQVPVTVGATDRFGQRFTQRGVTVNLSSHGMHLAGIACLRAPGEIVAVEYGKRQAMYRVVWIGARGTPLEGHVGLEDLEGGRLLFAGLIPSPEIEAAGCEIAETDGGLSKLHAAGERRGTERRQEERRQYKRWPCAGSARIRSGSSPPVEARVSELSRGGCYVEMMSPFPPGSKLRLEVQMLNRNFHCEAEVRSVQQGFGMGLKFQELSAEDSLQLLRMLAELAGEEVPPAEAAPAKPLPSSAIAPQPLADAVLRWFATHESLSRTEFLQLTEGSVAEPAAVH